jgi:uncharacterized protein (DUF1778 family)
MAVMDRLNLRLSQPTASYLRDAAALNGIPITEFVRRMLDDAVLQACRSCGHRSQSGLDRTGRCGRCCD